MSVTIGIQSRFTVPDLHRHVMQVLRNGNINVVLTWGEPIMHTERFDRKEMAKSLEATVRRLHSDKKPGWNWKTALRCPSASMASDTDIYMLSLR